MPRRKTARTNLIHHMTPHICWAYVLLIPDLAFHKSFITNPLVSGRDDKHVSANA